MSEELDRIAAELRDTWVRGDRKAMRAIPPKTKPSKAWQDGFDAGVIAMAVALQSAGGSMRLVHGARVFLLADHHIDTAMAAAADRFRKPVK